MSLRQKVSSAIRILRWNRDVSARASHLVVEKDPLITYESVIFSLLSKADAENVSGSTVFFERKLMSTKTSIKRIAAVAAVALTLGGFSAVSAHAAATPAIIAGTTAGGTAGANVTATAVNGTYTAFTITAGTDKYYTITSTGGSVFYPSTVASSTLSASGSAEIWSAGSGAVGTGTFAGTESLTVSALSATAGSQVVTIKGDTSAAQTLTITWELLPM